MMDHPVRSSLDELVQVQLFSSWLGLASPCRQATMAMISRDDGRWSLCHLGTGQKSGIDEDHLRTLLDEIAGRLVPVLNHEAIGLSKEMADAHFCGRWTDDHPEFMLRVTYRHETLCLYTTSQYAYLLPWHIGTEESWNHRISLALAELLPDNFLNKERLLGRELACLAAFPGLSRERYEAEKKRRARKDSKSYIRLAINQSRIAIRTIWPIQSRRHAKRLMAAKGKPEKLKALISKGINPDVVDAYGWSPHMHMLSPPVDAECFKLLVAAGANVNARHPEYQFTGLHVSAVSGEYRAVDLWIEAGCDVNARTLENETALMRGATWPRIITSLCEAGARVNDVDGDGNTAAMHLLKGHVYSHQERLDCLKLFAQFGTNFTIRNTQGENALDLARIAARMHLIETIVHTTLKEKHYTGLLSMPDVEEDPLVQLVKEAH